MSNKVIELYSYEDTPSVSDWPAIVAESTCRYNSRVCLKCRKSSPDITIGTCIVQYSREEKKLIICPIRFLEDQTIFEDCKSLFEEQDGDEFHAIPEFGIPGGSVDYVMVQKRGEEVVDFVGIELQALDTTGSVWPARNDFLQSVGVDHEEELDAKNFGMNWKMTAKTILVQLHHKVETFEVLNKHLVLVLQDHLLKYMAEEFSFNHVGPSTKDDPMHFHSYELVENTDSSHNLKLSETRSTDSAGISACLELQAEASVELEQLVEKLRSKISPQTKLF